MQKKSSLVLKKKKQKKCNQERELIETRSRFLWDYKKKEKEIEKKIQCDISEALKKKNRDLTKIRELEKQFEQHKKQIINDACNEEKAKIEREYQAKKVICRCQNERLRFDRKFAYRLSQLKREMCRKEQEFEINHASYRKNITEQRKSIHIKYKAAVHPHEEKKKKQLQKLRDEYQEHYFLI